LDKASSQRKIDEAEQQLFSLTAADQPSLADIQAKVREIGDLQGQQRIAYIQAVGKAAQVLTEEQRQKVVGQEPAAEHSEHH
jgi:Spy/CpxP family protein refolding chaperone